MLSLYGTVDGLEAATGEDEAGRSLGSAGVLSIYCYVDAGGPECWGAAGVAFGYRDEPFSGS